MNKIKRWLEQAHLLFPDQKEMNEENLALLPYLHAVYGADEAIRVLESGDDNRFKLEFLAGFLDKAEKSESLVRTDRISELEEFYKLLDSLVGRGVYRNVNEAFDAFARANFSGNLLPLGKRIDSVLGKGAFREIAEKFREEPESGSGLSENRKVSEK